MDFDNYYSFNCLEIRYTVHTEGGVIVDQSDHVTGSARERKDPDHHQVLGPSPSLAHPVTTGDTGNTENMGNMDTDVIEGNHVEETALQTRSE